MKSALSKIKDPLLGVGLLVGVWWAAIALTGLPEYLLPSPWQVLESGWAHRASLGRALASTTQSALLGFSLAALLGVGIGSLLAAVPWMRRAFYPLANLLQMVPVVAVAPMLTIWFGYGTPSVVACAALVALFPVIANTVDGLRGVDPKLRELFAIYGFSGPKTWLKLDLPAAAPQIFTGLRIAAGLSVIGTVVGEFVSGYIGQDAPIGIVILGALRESQTALVFAAVGLSALVGFALFFLVGLARAFRAPQP